MDTRRFSFSEREKYFAKIDRLIELKKRKHRLYNRIYRRSLIYVSTLVLRILFLLFFIWLFFTQGGSAYTDDEIVLSKYEETYAVSRKFKVSKLFFETNESAYEAHFEWDGMPLIRVGDTLQIERNIFGKPAFFSHKSWITKHKIYLNWLLYYMVGMTTIISLFFNDGLDPFTIKILWVTWTSNLFGFAHYFLT